MRPKALFPLHTNYALRISITNKNPPPEPATVGPVAPLRAASPSYKKLKLWVWVCMFPYSSRMEHQFTTNLEYLSYDPSYCVVLCYKSWVNQPLSPQLLATCLLVIHVSASWSHHQWLYTTYLVQYIKNKKIKNSNALKPGKDFWMVKTLKTLSWV